MKHIDDHKLWEYILGDLDPETVKRVKTHLKDCPSCHERYNIQLQFHNELFKLEDDRPAPGFSQKVIHNIERDLRLEKRLQFWLRFGKIAVISALVIAVVLPLLVMVFQQIAFSVDYKIVNNVVVPLLSICVLLWLLYTLDVILNSHINRP